MRSRYVVFPAPGLVALEEEVVGRPGVGEILCRAEVSLISTGTESTCLRGVADPGTNWADWLRFPFRPGYSMVARVIAVGAGVDRFAEGDRVAGWVEHREHFVIAAEQAQRVPDALTAEEASWVVLGSTTQLAVRRAGIVLGEDVAVIGLGQLGQLVVQYCRLSGARTITAIDTAPVRLEAALTHGATHALAVDAASARPAIAEATAGRMLDVVFDVTGHPDVLAPAIGLVRQLGRVVLLGDTAQPTQQRLGPGVVSNSVAILGIHALARPDVATDFAPWGAREIGALFLDLVAQGRLKVRDLVTHRYSPLEAAAAYDALETDRSGMLGVVFDWSRLSR